MLLSLCCLLIVDNVDLTSNKERLFLCPGDQVTFTCRIVESFSLEWRSPLITQTVRYTGRSTPPAIFISAPFNATLISVNGNALNSNMTSTLQVTASRMIMRDDTTVTCLSSTPESESDNFTVAGK